MFIVSDDGEAMIHDVKVKTLKTLTDVGEELKQIVKDRKEIVQQAIENPKDTTATIKKGREFKMSSNSPLNQNLCPGERGY